MTTKDKAIKLDAQGKCIVCEKTDKKRTRGLCSQHYQQFKRRRDSLKSDEARQRWEELAIESGKLLASRQGQRSDSQDAFADLFAKFAEQMPDAVSVTSPEQKH